MCPKADLFLVLSFFVDGPPPCSPSKVRWLKAYNKVRVKLHEVGRLFLLPLYAALTHSLQKHIACLAYILESVHCI